VIRTVLLPYQTSSVLVRIWGSTGLSAIRVYICRLFDLFLFIISDWQKKKKKTFYEKRKQSNNIFCFCEQDMCQRWHAFRETTFKRRYRVSFSRSKPDFIFVKTFFVGGSLQVESAYIQVYFTKEETYFVRWWSTFLFQCFRVSVRLIFQPCIIFANMDLSEK